MMQLCYGAEPEPVPVPVPEPERCSSERVRRNEHGMRSGVSEKGKKSN